MMKQLIAIAQDEKAPPGVRATCAEKVLDRAWGRPAQHSTLSVGVGRLTDLSDEQLLAILAGRDVDVPMIEAQPVTDGSQGNGE